jgi:transposase-like protein
VKERGRFSSQRKLDAVLRVLRGESLDQVSRDLGVTAGALAGWRDAVLAGGQSALRARPEDERDEEIRRLRAKVGEITMANELLLERCHRVEANRPLDLRRSRR